MAIQAGHYASLGKQCLAASPQLAKQMHKVLQNAEPCMLCRAQMMLARLALAAVMKSPSQASRTVMARLIDMG